MADDFKYDGFLNHDSKDRSVTSPSPTNSQPLSLFTGHTSYVRGVALTSDARRAVSGSADNTLRMWDLSRCIGADSLPEDP